MKYVLIINLDENTQKRDVYEFNQNSNKDSFEKINHPFGNLYVNFLLPFDSDTVHVYSDKILLGKAYFKNSSKKINKEAFRKKLISPNEIYGKYILVEKQQGEINVWRDPIGQLGCYYKKLIFF